MLLQTVRPYTPRQFPLAEAQYQAMVSAMPAGFHACASPASPASPPSPASPASPASDSSSTLSPPDLAAYEGDDPDDAEWDPSAERADRRKSFR